MRVLVLTQHFTPEVTAGRFRMEALVSCLVDRGHDVHVVCAIPNHPGGVVHEGYRGRVRLTRRVLGATVTYVWVATSPKKSFARRLANYGSFAALATATGVGGRRPDVILGSSPPLSVGAAAATVAIRHRVPWVLDVRDVWPASAVALGELINPRAVRLAERLEEKLYARANAIATVNDAFARHIRNRAPRDRRIEVIPNGTTAAWLDAGSREPDDRGSLDLPDDAFIWAYAGNIGLAHGLEASVEAAELLGDGFELLVIGDGPRRADLEQRVARMRAGAVDMRGLMPAREAARFLRAADALLVSERQEQTVASKLYDYCAVGRPVIAACQGELRRVIEASSVGLVIPHGDAAALAGAVRELRADATLRARLAERGRAFASEHRRELQSLRLAELLEAVPHGNDG